MYKIYKLIDPISDTVRYVGVTTRKLQSRFSQHKHSALTSKSELHVHRWFRRVYNKEGLLPIIELIEECEDSIWEEREKYWINFYSNLTNTREGGKGVILNRSEDSVQRSANGHKKRIVQLDKEYGYIKTWKSLNEACKFYNISSASSISNCLRGEANHSIGFIWVYEIEWITGNFDKTKRKSKFTEVYQYSKDGLFIQSYESVAEAVIDTRCNYYSKIFEAASRNGFSNGYHWSFSKKSRIEIWSMIRLDKQLVENNRFYSYKEIADEYSIDLRYIRNKFNNMRQNKLYKEEGLFHTLGCYWREGLKDFDQTKIEWKNENSND